MLTQSASPTQFLQWQIIDSLLPTGGFAHSYGLEAALQSNLFNDPPSDADENAAAVKLTFEKYVKAILRNIARQDLPFVHCCHAHNPSRDPQVAISLWRQAEVEYGSMLSNHVARRASIVQGGALLRLSAAGGMSPNKQVQNTLEEIRGLVAMSNSNSDKLGLPRGYGPTVFGTITSLMGFDSEDAQRMYLFMVLRDVLSASVRLSICGPINASRLQAYLSEHMEAMLQENKNKPISEAHSDFLLGDIIQGCHDKLYSRLFNS